MALETIALDQPLPSITMALVKRVPGNQQRAIVNLLPANVPYPLGRVGATDLSDL